MLPNIIDAVRNSESVIRLTAKYVTKSHGRLNVTIELSLLCNEFNQGYISSLTVFVLAVLDLLGSLV